MRAILSGQAGLALFERDGRLYCMRADDPVAPTLGTDDVYRLLEECGDTVEYADIPLEDLVAALASAYRKDCCLHLVLICLDSSVPVDTRHEAVREAEALLSEPGTLDFVANRLWVAPLPSASDVDWVATTCLECNYLTMSSFVSNLRLHQRAIRFNRSVWDSLPLELFGSAAAKEKFGYVAANEGVFRLLTTDSFAELSSNYVTVLANRALQKMPAYFQIITAWVKLCKSYLTGTTVATSEPVETASDLALGDYADVAKSVEQALHHEVLRPVPKKECQTVFDVQPDSPKFTDVPPQLENNKPWQRDKPQ